MPGTVALLGIFIGIWRRRTEGHAMAFDEAGSATPSKKKKEKRGSEKEPGSPKEKEP